MKVKVKIPESLKDLTLEQYQKYMSFVSQGASDTLCSLELVRIFCGLDIKNVKQICVTDFKYMTEKVNGLFKQKTPHIRRFTLDGIDYGFIPNIEKMSIGEYIDLSDLIVKPETFHKALAIMYRPVTHKNKDLYRIEKYTEDTVENLEHIMKKVTMDIAMAANFFFYNLAKDLLHHIPHFLRKEIQKMKKDGSLPTNYSLNSGDGTLLSMLWPKAVSKNLTELQN